MDALLDWLSTHAEHMTAAIIKINAPNGVTLAIVSAASIEAWLKVAMVLTSIICTILLTRQQMRKKGKP